MPSSEYKLVVFDWDGTLIDSISTIIECTQATLAELGLPRADEDALRSAIGLGLRETVETFSPGCDDITFDRIVEVYRRLWFGSFSREPSLFEGVECLLEDLSREGRLMAVATAKSRSGLDADLVRTGVGRFFGASRTVDEAPSKPNPGMLIELLEEFGVDSGQSLMIGDSVHDLEMARNAGVAALGVSSGSTCRELLLEERPLDCLDRVTALPGWFESNPA
jgi:phosphoglycolate phosphatase